MNCFVRAYLGGLHSGIQKKGNWRSSAKEIGGKALDWAKTPAGAGTLIGAAGGAATGAAVDKENRGRGALVGGMLGGSTGYAGGTIFSIIKQNLDAKAEKNHLQRMEDFWSNRTHDATSYPFGNPEIEGVGMEADVEAALTSQREHQRLKDVYRPYSKPIPGEVLDRNMVYFLQKETGQPMAHKGMTQEQLTKAVSELMARKNQANRGTGDFSD